MSGLNQSTPSIPLVNPYANYYMSQPPIATAAPNTAVAAETVVPLQNIYHQTVVASVPATWNDSQQDAKSIAARMCSSSSSAAAASTATAATATAATAVAAPIISASALTVRPKRDFNIYTPMARALEWAQSDAKMLEAATPVSTTTNSATLRAVSSVTHPFYFTEASKNNSTLQISDFEPAPTVKAETIDKDAAAAKQKRLDEQKYQRFLRQLERFDTDFATNVYPFMSAFNGIIDAVKRFALVSKDLDQASIGQCQKVLELIDSALPSFEFDDLVRISLVLLPNARAKMEEVLDALMSTAPNLSFVYENTLEALDYLLFAQIEVFKDFTSLEDRNYQLMKGIAEGREESITILNKKISRSYSPDFDISQMQIQNSWNPGKVTCFFVTALGYACGRGDIEVVRVLIKLGANPNFYLEDEDNIETIMPAWYALLVSSLTPEVKKQIWEIIAEKVELNLNMGYFCPLSRAAESLNFSAQDMLMVLAKVKELKHEELDSNYQLKDSVLKNMLEDLSERLDHEDVLESADLGDRLNGYSGPPRINVDSNALKDHTVQLGAVIISNGGLLGIDPSTDPDNLVEPTHTRIAFEWSVNFNGTPLTLLQIERIRKCMVERAVDQKNLEKAKLKEFLNSFLCDDVSRIIVKYCSDTITERDAFVSQCVFDLLFPAVPAQERPSKRARIRCEADEKAAEATT